MGFNLDLLIWLSVTLMSSYGRHVSRFRDILKILQKSVIFYSPFKSNGNVIVIVTELLLKKCNCNCNNYIF